MINQGMDTFPSHPLFFLSPIGDRGTRAIGIKVLHDLCGISNPKIKMSKRTT